VLENYRQHVAEREEQGVPPQALSAKQVSELVELIQNPPKGEGDFLVELLTHRVPPGVDQAAKVKADFLTEVANAKIVTSLVSAALATELLGTMLGGFNIDPLVALLDNNALAPIAVKALSKTLLMFDAQHDVVEKAKTNNFAKQVVDSWANAEWFTNKPKLAEKITVTVFKVEGETNTDDLSPASEAWSRPDIPVHAKSMLINSMDYALGTIESLRKQGNDIAYVGDVVGTGSSRKSAIN
jgi:aconitate hydratase 2/2-methylisocitrate dehydratase